MSPLKNITDWAAWLPNGNVFLDRIWQSNAISNARCQLTSLVFPPICTLCSVEVCMGKRLCEGCAKQLSKAEYSCRRCAMPIPSVLPNEDCVHCRGSHWRFSQVIALGQYRGKLKEAVIICKKMNSDSLRFALSELLAARIQQSLPQLGNQNPVLVPVPNHWSRAFTGAAPTAFHLACLLSIHTGWQVKTGIIKRIRKTQKQGMLSITQRRQNMRGAFIKKNALSLTGRHVLIVDDVLTSGATANEIARQVARGNPSSISAVVVARATGR